jgi:hypothetical protein
MLNVSTNVYITSQDKNLYGNFIGLILWGNIRHFHLDENVEHASQVDLASSLNHFYSDKIISMFTIKENKLEAYTGYVSWMGASVHTDADGRSIAGFPKMLIWL